mmetsp:Transcript_18561/g.27532  ORF Transcript_18561/g.27532 Transcript_18561/m.27532 type:complete len:306 (-) Transcript_18561:133-1050(-)|eukprot:CAMPEP_0194214624 /NCGR_PEP_ID=MMETSP0156-20130528/15938_1 /TAXON_ID=33649 /ORGANISM="Thalassionema nitzschioides, Strain L26-B" /LENGTH=305 /DNA_ID=CAMNT_0038942925 /DNA_START=84 /DNA_END=1001 /DNA_ORIENTATION=+
MTYSEGWIDFIAGWFSGGAAVIACQPIDTVLTRLQAGASSLSRQASMSSSYSSYFSSRPAAKSLVSNFGVSSLWRGSSAMISAVPMQNALLMSGYGIGKRWSEQNTPNKVYLGVFCGGCCGGVLQSFLMSPVELIKVEQQVVGTSALSATRNVAKGFLSAQNGAWRGLGATLLRDGIPHGVWFLSYEYAKNSLVERARMNQEKSSILGSNSSNSVGIPLLSGAFAATVAWAVGYPFDLIKTRIQAGGTKGIIDTAKELVHESGGRPILGLYRGFTLKLVRAIPASAIGFFVYEYVKDSMSNKMEM